MNQNFKRKINISQKLKKKFQRIEYWSENQNDSYIKKNFQMIWKVNKIIK